MKLSDSRRLGSAGGLAMLVAVALLATPTRVALAGRDTKDLLSFAADMAKQGNWREALYRWEEADRTQQNDPKILNNLAVAHEAMGQPEAARGYYERALALSPDDERIEENRVRFERFWSRTNPDAEAADASTEAALVPATQASGSGKGAKGKTAKVTVFLPVPPRLDTTPYKTLLVASFLSEENTLVNVPDEMVRFVRSKLRKDRELEVLDVTPAPAVPEQTLPDLIDNREFWKYLGREYGADLIVSGVVDYDRRDYSGFEDVDRIDPTTGQKVRQAEFVERERFGYAFDILFFEGSSGDLVYRDRLQRSAVYRGSNNDPLTAFFDLSESLSGDLMAIVEPRNREDVRLIFKK